MSYAARVLADSVYGDSPRLITVEAMFPRFILAEVNTHRVFSRNSASSRAIPPEKQIEKALSNPFIPEVFCTRIKGMGQGEPVADQESARNTWLDARDFAVRQARMLIELNISKAHVNRLLEPFIWHSAIITATEWENFFALRCPPGEEVDLDFPAQPEFQQIAILMRRAMRESTPRVLGPDEWHLPLVHEDERSDPMACGISAGRCATKSYEKEQAELEDATASIARSEKLGEAGHMSPMEHQARPACGDELIDASLVSNLLGWVQYRKLIPYEENRVGHLEGRAPWEETPVNA